MWNSFKFYLSILLMCVACTLPVAIFRLPQSAISAAGAVVVFFAGGGLTYAFASLYNESYQSKKREFHETLIRVMSLVFTVIAIVLQVVVFNVYKDSSTFGLMHMFIGFEGNVAEFYMRLATSVFSGLALYPLFVVVTGQIDTDQYVFVRKTYYQGEEIKREYITKSCDESKAMFFFATVLVACIGLMATSFAVILIVLGLNVGQFFKGKMKRVPLIVGIILALAVTVFGVINGYQLGDARFGAVINVACEILPIIFAILTSLLFVCCFNVEWFCNVVVLIIATVVMIGISWFGSYFLSDILLNHVIQILG